MSERVYSYFAFDGEAELPEEGVAAFRGKPHYFWLRDVGTSPGIGLFDLAPIDDALFKLVIEQESVWHAWDLDYHAGKVELESHPMHPGVNIHYAELHQKISQAALLLREKAFLKSASFTMTKSYLEHVRQFAGQRWPNPGNHSATFEVAWSDVQPPSP